MNLLLTIHWPKKFKILPSWLPSPDAVLPLIMKSMQKSLTLHFQMMTVFLYTNNYLIRKIMTPRGYELNTRFDVVGSSGCDSAFDNETDAQGSYFSLFKHEHHTNIWEIV